MEKPQFAEERSRVVAYIRCRLRPGVSEAIVLQQLRTLGLKDESVISDLADTVHLFGSLPDHTIARLEQPPFNFLISEITPYDPTIDWEAQWANSGADYREGHVYLNLQGDKQIKLKPGPGFGDLSHPTTRLTIDLMRNQVTGKEVIDFGSGSGILSLAAAALGAATVLGVEIDLQAILHACANAQLNDLQDQIAFAEPSDVDITLQPAGLYLMNMIPADQEALITGLGFDLPLPGTWIVSGVLAERREEYLKSIANRGWKIVTEKSEAGWLAFEFNQL